MKQATSTFSPEKMSITYVCGLDIGSQSCSGCVLRLDRSVVLKPMTFENTKAGWQVWMEHLSRLDAPANEILIGMEATSRYGENLYQELAQHGYVLRLLHPGQTHHFHQQRGLRAKTDRVDAMTIARALLSGDARACYVPDDQIIAYRELVRLQDQLREEASAYQNQIHILVVVLFPEFTQVFADPCKPTALSILHAFPSAQAVRQAGVEPLLAVLRSIKSVHYGLPTAERLVALAKASGSSGKAIPARSLSLQLLCNQLITTQRNLARLDAELHQLLSDDPAAKSLQQISDFGPTTVAVLRAELGDVQRFTRTDEVVAYAGLDIEIKESGRWKGESKLSKRGSGLLRRMLYLAALRSIRETAKSAFGDYYRRVVARGLKKSSALMSVMRKMLTVATHLLMNEQEVYDPLKVGASSVG